MSSYKASAVASIRQMKKNRKKYFPVLSRFAASAISQGEELSADRDIFLILELIDIGYLDAKAFSVYRSFNEIQSVIFTGPEAVTFAGREFLRSFEKKKMPYLAALSLLTALFVIALVKLMR